MSTDEIGLEQQDASPNEPSGTPERLGLALSGGGFRATLFHLGVLRFLNDTGLLPRVLFIGGVSGGSILAMHAGLNWKRYTGRDSEFDAAASEVVAFCQSDVRNRILRRWLFAWLTLVPRLFLGWSRTNLLIKEYRRLFGEATLDDLPLDDLPPRHRDRPRIIVQAVSLSTGQPCSFGRSGFMDYEVADGGYLGEDEVSKRAPHLPAAFAVAASSAFPPMFPPIRITASLLHVPANEFRKEQYITDGGVYDNLGIERPLWYYETHDELDAFLISDAGGMFHWAEGAFKLALPRNVRATDLLMKRVGDLVQQRLRDRTEHELLSVGIAAESDSLSEGSLPPAVQRRVSGVRTDLDAFTDLEIHSVVRHGYAVAHAEAVRLGWVSATTPRGDWSPVDVTPPSAEAWADSLVDSSRKRVLPLFTLTDWPLWAGVIWLIVVLGAIYFLA